MGISYDMCGMVVEVLGHLKTIWKRNVATFKLGIYLGTEMMKLKKKKKNQSDLNKYFSLCISVFIFISSYRNLIN